jgi:hypothetical protein
MADFYFLGTLAQYWKAVYAEYVRLTAILEDEPFAIIASGGLKLPLSEYEPTVLDTVIIQFADREYGDFGADIQAAHPKPPKPHGDCIVSVKASTVLGAEQVNLDVDIYVDALKKSDGSVYARWLEIQNTWLEKQLLINPHAYLAELAQLGSKHEPLSKPQSGADLDLFFDRFHQRKKEGQKYTLIQIAAETGYEYPYVRQLHSKYLKKLGLTRSKKRTNKRTNKN